MIGRLLKFSPLDFDDTGVYSGWAKRLRDFSCMIKDLQQRFTQWYNRQTRGAKRRGTVWKSRFKSQIIETAKKAVKNIIDMVGPIAPFNASRYKKWRRFRKRNSFLLSKFLATLAMSGILPIEVARIFICECSRLPHAGPLLSLLGDLLNPDKPPGRSR